MLQRIIFPVFLILNPLNLSCKPFQQVKEFKSGTLIANPPYGIRLGELEEVKALYKELGDFLKTNCTGTSAFIYTGNPTLRKSIGLRTTKRVHLDNGKLEGVLVQIDSYEGSKKTEIGITNDCIRLKTLRSCK